MPHPLTVCRSLNTLELKSLEEPAYLMEQFFKHPRACLGLVPYVTCNTGVLLEMLLSCCFSDPCLCVLDCVGLSK